MTYEYFTRIIPWYEATPTARHFIYHDKITKLYFAIIQLERGNELQGAGYDIVTAYNRLCKEANKVNYYEVIPLDSFAVYGKLDREVSYKVRG